MFMLVITYTEESIYPSSLLPCIRLRIFNALSGIKALCLSICLRYVSGMVPSEVPISDKSVGILCYICWCQIVNTLFSFVA